jgi:hypothetical protein
MALPKIAHPLFDVKIPSNSKKIKMRPMLVKEEKILLMAKSSDDQNEMLNAVKQVVNNCIASDGIDIDKLALFDIEYLFIKVRAFSIGNITKVSYMDNEDELTYDFDVNLDDVSIFFPENIDKNIKVSKDIVIVMKYAEASLYSDNDTKNINATNFLDILVTKCIDKVFEGDVAYDASSFTQEELQNYIEELDTASYTKMKNFVMSMPRLDYVIKYTNAKGTNREIIMSSLTDFFTLR